jgi:hypothetical protein
MTIAATALAMQDSLGAPLRLHAYESQNVARLTITVAIVLL